MDNAERFEEFYSELFSDRWETLRAAFAADGVYKELKEGLRKSYFLDQASFAAAKQLEVEPGHQVLDLCAAPGGKSLVLASDLFALTDLEKLRIEAEEAKASGIPAHENKAEFEALVDKLNTSKLICNDRSNHRRNRLKKVIQEHLPPDILDQIVITGRDASRWGIHEKNLYDRVLLDVPCSSEAHLIKNPKELHKWTKNRTKNLSQQAYAMLLSAMEAVKPGGYIVYSTCALSPKENEQTVIRALERRKGLCEIVTPSKVDDNWEAKDPGYQILPDVSTGAGPIYFCKLIKKQSSKEF
jgi:16S rRNA C967 or C1407 C5-methylase (RsmB/RsmF family)